MHQFSLVFLTYCDHKHFHNIACFHNVRFGLTRCLIQYVAPLRSLQTQACSLVFIFIVICILFWVMTCHILMDQPSTVMPEVGEDMTALSPDSGNNVWGVLHRTLQYLQSVPYLLLHPAGQSFGVIHPCLGALGTLWTTCQSVQDHLFEF